MDRREFLNGAALGTSTLAFGYSFWAPERIQSAVPVAFPIISRPTNGSQAVSSQIILSQLISFCAAGKFLPEEGILHGAEEFETDSLVVVWMATLSAIEYASKIGSRLIVCHEPLTMHDYFPAIAEPRPWTADKARLRLLEKHGITVIRLHTSVDTTHVIAEFYKSVGISKPIESGKNWSFHHEEPIALQTLARKVSTGLRMDKLRVTGDPLRKVSRLFCMVGGLGLDRHLDLWEHDAMPRNIDVLITGETSDFAQRFAVDSGIGLIETSHSASEEPGLVVLAKDIQARIPELRVYFFKNEVPWTSI